MIIEKKSYLDILEKFQITPNQLWFLILTSEKDYRSLYRYVRNVSPFEPTELEDLKNKKLLKEEGGGDSDYADNFRTTSRFEKVYRIEDEMTRAEEFWDGFPQFIYVKGNKMPARSTDKDALLDDYAATIGRYPEKHQQVMEGLRKAKQAGGISMGIFKWYKSYQWETYVGSETGNKSKVPYGGNEF